MKRNKILLASLIVGAFSSYQTNALELPSSSNSKHNIIAESAKLIPTIDNAINNFKTSSDEIFKKIFEIIGNNKTLTSDISTIFGFGHLTEKSTTNNELTIPQGEAPTLNKNEEMHSDKSASASQSEENMIQNSKMSVSSKDEGEHRAEGPINNNIDGQSYSETDRQSEELLPGDTIKEVNKTIEQKVPPLSGTFGSGPSEASTGKAQENDLLNSEKEDQKSEQSEGFISPLSLEEVDNDNTTLTTGFNEKNFTTFLKNNKLSADIKIPETVGELQTFYKDLSDETKDKFKKNYVQQFKQIEEKKNQDNNN